MHGDSKLSMTSCPPSSGAQGVTFRYATEYKVPKIVIRISCLFVCLFVSSNCRPYGVHWWWVPVAGPFVGAPLGAWTYYWLIEFQHPPIEIKKTAEVVANPMVVLANGDKTSDEAEIEDNTV